MGFGRVIARAGVAGGAAVVYGRWLRPRLTDWGATHEEVAGPYPGRELVPDGERSGAMAVTIDAPPEQVWPWLVQVGWARGGWYSWDHLDNAGRPSAREIHPEWQDTAVGDQLRYWVPGVGPMDAYSVAVLEPPRFLGLHGLSDLRGRTLDPEQPRPSAYLEGLWGFLLEELPGGRTRLVVSGYQAARPRWLGRLLFYWLFPPVVWIMQARMLSVLKRNVERAAGTGTERVPAPRTPQVEAGADEPPVGAQPQPAVSRARTSSGQGAARPSESQT